MNRTLLAISAMACGLAAQQQVTLPDYHYLCEHPSQLGSSGSALWWRPAGPGRFQVLYEGSHFTSAGVTGPVTLTKIKFRVEDGETNLGGQVYNGVTVEVGSTSVAAAAMSTTFATNRAPTAPATTTMGTLGTTNVNVAPAAGSVPNNWSIELDLVAMGNTITFNPTSTEPNLLIDINVPTAPVGAPPLALPFFSNSTGTVAQIRGAGVTSTASGATTGAANATPILVGVEFLGIGGYANVVPARNEHFGGACGGSAASFYQGFVNGQAFDLGAGLTMIPDSTSTPTFYNVVPSAPAVDITQVNATPDQIADDGIVTFPLPFTVPFPGGSTSTIVASTNGFVWLDPAMTDTAFAAVASRLLGDPVPGTTAPAYSGARHAIYWTDLNMQRNVGLNPAAGLHVKADTSGGPGNGVCYVTWWDVATFNVIGGIGVHGHARWTFQIALHESGLVEYRYGSVPAIAASSSTTAACYGALVGFSPGRVGGLAGNNAADPQNRDLSLEAPFATKPELGVGNLGQVAIATPNAGGAQYGGRLYFGQTVTWNATNVPPGTVIGAQLLDLGSTRPGLQLPGITAPGCMLSTTTGALLWEVFVLPSGTATGAVPFVVPAGIYGVDLYAQWVALGGLFGGPDLISASSNAIKHTIGLN
jgi:hypothetical protein